MAPAPSRATVHRVLARNGLVNAQRQEHKRKYRRWQREAPMHLWQLDLVGGIPPADGRECKMVTGIDDHSRFAMIAAVVAVPSRRAVCSAFTAVMRRYGVPFEVLSDNGKQFTGRHIRPQPVEVLFERVFRENGINQRLTKPQQKSASRAQSSADKNPSGKLAGDGGYRQIQSSADRQAAASRAGGKGGGKKGR